MSDKGPQAFSWKSQMEWVIWEQNENGAPKHYWRERPSEELITNSVRNIFNRLALEVLDVSVKYLCTGGFNSTFVVSTIEKETETSAEYIFRIPIPKHPYFKMECEIATMEYVRHYTSIPVPVVYAYDSSTDNQLGLEWMLMEKVKGENVNRVWMNFGNEKHIQIAKQVAAWQDELSKITYDKIGGLYVRWMPKTIEFFIGPPPDSSFSMNRRLLYDFNSGPYSSLAEFYDALLQLNLLETHDPVLEALHVAELARRRDLDKLHPSVVNSVALAEAEIHEDDIENWLSNAWSPSTAEKAALKGLMDALPLISPLYLYEPLRTSLQHTDISGNNLLMDRMGNITALLDWESNGFWPVRTHFPNRYPPLLTGYYDYQEKYSSAGPVRHRDSSPTDLDWENLEQNIEEIVLTHLRQVYRNELEVLKSPLLQLFEDEDDEGFYKALQRHVTYPFAEGVMEWLKSNGLYHGEDEEEVEEHWSEEEASGVNLIEAWGDASTWLAWGNPESSEAALAEVGQVHQDKMLSDCSEVAVEPGCLGRADLWASRWAPE
ncbi:hypothetical protein MMC11_000274 [Xylographa trunciseda]|nr:hypothetical protein [Xylographa trunciseda]